jgi:hypothetical protein
MNKITRRLLRTDGTSEDLPAPVTIKQIEKLIGARCIDCVNLRHMGDPRHVMCVDDAGYEVEAVEDGNVTTLVPVRPLKPINLEATRLYHLNCAPGTTHAIVGDVVILPDEDFA